MAAYYVSRPFRAGARAPLIQSEYDRWFYDRKTLDQFPSVKVRRSALAGLQGFGGQGGGQDLLDAIGENELDLFAHLLG